MFRLFRSRRRTIHALCIILVLLLAYMVLLAGSSPTIRHFRVSARAWPKGTRARRIVLLTDLHISGPDTDLARLDHIIRQVNGLRPDMVLFAGDFMPTGKLVTRRYDPAEAIAPLARLQAPSGRFAVLGNHDHWADLPAIRAALVRAKIRLLNNDAVRVGNIAIGGVDDDYTGHADVPTTITKLRRLGGVAILLSHSPDIFPATPTWAPLVLAGHTHCGQVSLPWIGPLFTASRYGRRFACGVIGENGHQMIVSAGIGTSVLPIRFGTHPEIWVIDVGT